MGCDGPRESDRAEEHRRERRPPLLVGRLQGVASRRAADIDQRTGPLRPASDDIHAIRQPEIHEATVSPGAGSAANRRSYGRSHCHRSAPGFLPAHVKDRAIRTYPILFDGATISEVRRGDWCALSSSVGGTTALLACSRALRGARE
jgi:hypothetical protein